MWTLLLTVYRWFAQIRFAQVLEISIEMREWSPILRESSVSSFWHLSLAWWFVQLSKRLVYSAIFSYFYKLLTNEFFIQMTITSSSQSDRRLQTIYMVTGQFADKPTRSRSSCGLVNSRTIVNWPERLMKNWTYVCFPVNYSICTLEIFDKVRTRVTIRFSYKI